MARVIGVGFLGFILAVFVAAWVSISVTDHEAAKSYPACLTTQSGCSTQALGS